MEIRKALSLITVCSSHQLLLLKFLKTQGLHHNKISVYYHAANGAIEGFHRSLKGCIQTAILQSQPWKKAVTNWLQEFHATPHATTSTSPYELLYGRKM